MIYLNYIIFLCLLVIKQLSNHKEHEDHKNKRTQYVGFHLRKNRSPRGKPSENSLLLIEPSQNETSKTSRPRQRFSPRTNSTFQNILLQTIQGLLKSTKVNASKFCLNQGFDLYFKSAILTHNFGPRICPQTLESSDVWVKKVKFQVFPLLFGFLLDFLFFDLVFLLLLL